MGQRDTKIAANMATGKHRKPQRSSKAGKMALSPLVRRPSTRCDQPVLLRSRANRRAQPDFSEILQDRHRPPSDLADGL